MSSILQSHLGKRRSGIATGIYSVCSAHPWVIRAAAEQAVEDGSLLLVEATSNQVNQFGGYTGMRPQAFRAFVLGHISKAGLPIEKLILGGDHLGPNPWRNKSSSEAMDAAKDMVAEYVSAGFMKIHLDASMALVGDAVPLSDEVVAERAVQLCLAAEAARTSSEAPVYVIGTEVPTPGGATHVLQGVEITPTEAAEKTLAVHKQCFLKAGLADTWQRVIALVVQPGVEFDHDSVVEYDPAKTGSLTHWLDSLAETIVFEAHSTDYQLPQAYPQLVQNGFAILKVGPALTFAMREALYALADMETQLVPEARQSRLAQVVEETMVREPEAWEPYYAGSSEQQRLLRVYSYSDRVRYYWHRPAVAAAVEKLITNISAVKIPESMCSRYLPAQYNRLRQGKIAADPVSLIIDAVRDVLRAYAAACTRS
jgi:D-tagatose-1,6-bisphosphate aldolase subunit GatZ/KbaZ